ncbi:hypothetical protein [Pseudoalteromonas sp. Of11M-6]|uniref:hypothetical protein n=1 Tax=Pseudoalteromonas sp. Of11M-6 TaxID=2917754 RepID=UPI001EF441FC|nr:hypothetical protein [Pseudoalteromonas sp. Of11M-6]MCG7556257.1 hypothetical protein [Pseudoalteromonas sp. Of11M-6]
MTKNNNFDPIKVDDNEYKIDHLKDLSLIIDMDCQNGDTRPITVHMRPTNHLFSREVTDDDKANRAKLEGSGHWLNSYIHHEGNYQQVKTPPKIKESRIFCKEKWEYSFLFPKFVALIEETPSHVTVLANAGDDKTCLSGILEIEDRPEEVYLVFFVLTKINSKEASMLIESAYCVDPNVNSKAKKLINPARDDSKPFVIALRNVMEGRKPLESKKQNSRAHKRRKKNRHK